MEALRTPIAWVLFWLGWIDCARCFIEWG